MKNRVSYQYNNRFNRKINAKTRKKKVFPQNSSEK